MVGGGRKTIQLHAKENTWKTDMSVKRNPNKKIMHEEIQSVRNSISCGVQSLKFCGEDSRQEKYMLLS